MLDRKLVCRIMFGENVLSELLDVMFDKETAEVIENLVKWHIPFRIQGGEEKGESLFFKAVTNAGGIVIPENKKTRALKNIPVIVLERNLTVKRTRNEIITEEVKAVFRKLPDESEVTAFYKIGRYRWAIEVNDRYFGIYDTKKCTFSKK